MNNQNGAFVLTREHLERGLTGEDMSAYAGIPIAVAYHDDFPHSAELRKYRQLPDDKVAERGAAIAHYLEKANLGKLVAHASSIATVPSADCSSIKRFADLSRIETDEFGAWNPFDINRRYLLSANPHDAESRDRWIVAPEPYGVSDENNFSRPWIYNQAFVTTNPFHEDVEQYWSCYALLPARLITNAPDPQVGRISLAAHEMRHLIQLHELEYYQEIDADLFVRSVLRDQLPGLKIDPAQHLQENLFARYASILALNSAHQVAPAIEAFEAGKSPPEVRLITAALNEMLDHICAKDTGAYPTEESRHAWRCINHDPESLYSLLRRCAEEGAFRQNPLADQIANRILQSVEYFAENVSRSPSVVNKIYQVRLAA